MSTAAIRPGRIELRAVGLRHLAGRPALAGIDLEVASGERLAILGASGSGKTSLLRVVAGLSRPTSGVVRLDGRDAGGIPPHRRGVAMAFQQPAVYPHLDVAANLAFGLAEKGAERDATIRRAAARLRIEGLLDRRPAQLSGGQIARVALGRTMLRDVPILLLDEPFSGLDAPLRIELRELVLDLHRESPRTTLFVTHDATDAVAFGERIAVLAEGRLVQCGEPMAMYEDPETLSVATALGGADWNRLDGGEEEGRRVVRMVRREAVRIEAGELSKPGTVLRIEGSGTGRTVVLEVEGARLRAPAPEGGIHSGDVVPVRIDLARSPRFDAETGRRLRSPFDSK